MSISRRHFLQAVGALAGLVGPSNWSQLAARQALLASDLLQPVSFGNVTIAHVTDMHAQLLPIYFREPSVNIGVGSAKGSLPHLSGSSFRSRTGIAEGSPAHYALTHDDFGALAAAYGRLGGADRIATVLEAIRSDRPDTIVLDGGDTWQGSLTALRTQARDMVAASNALGVDAMTAHWEFTLGLDRVTQIVDEELDAAFLGANIFDAEWDEPAYEPYRLFERGGALVAVIGQAFPYLPIANPRWMFPDLSFGIRTDRLRELVADVRARGAGAVILLSHNGFDVDRRLAVDVEGIDVILTGHTHDALPQPIVVNGTHLVASGSHGKFVSRIDLDVGADAVRAVSHRLIPVFADVIPAEPTMKALIAKHRAPFLGELNEVFGQTESTLFRRGNFNGTWDDLICDALRSEMDAEIALSPGFRWGASLLAGSEIRREDVFNVTAMSYPSVYRRSMTGRALRMLLEDVADNIFNPDPYYQQGGDMVRVGGIGYKISIGAPAGERISDLTLLAENAPLDPERTYTVAGWASVDPETDGPPIWQVLEAYIRRQGAIVLAPNRSVIIDPGEQRQ